MERLGGRCNPSSRLVQDNPLYPPTPQISYLNPLSLDPRQTKATGWLMGKEKRGATEKKMGYLSRYQIGFFSSFFLKQDNALICDDDSPFSKRGTRKEKTDGAFSSHPSPDQATTAYSLFLQKSSPWGRREKTWRRAGDPGLPHTLFFSLSSLQYTEYGVACVSM